MLKGKKIKLRTLLPTDLEFLQKIENDKPYNVGMIMETHRRYQEELKQIHMKNLMEERTMEEDIEEEAKRVVLWN